MDERRINEIKMIIPTNEAKVNELISGVGNVDLAIEEIEKELNINVAKLKEDAGAKINNLRERRFSFLVAVYVFYDRNREKITRAGEKLAKFSSGRIRFFIDSNKTIKIKNVKEFIKTLKKLKLSRFIKETRKEEPIRPAIALESEIFERIEGITIIQEEIFEIKPELTGKAVTEKVKKLKKLLKHFK